MGYGTKSTYSITRFQPVLEFAGQPLTIGQITLMDRQFAGVDMPPAALQLLRSCHGKKWLIPKGDRPFDLENLYDAKAATFGTLFRTQFMESYAISSTTQYFDVWSCKNDLSSTRAD